jgi:hypothetical protein
VNLRDVGREIGASGGVLRQLRHLHLNVLEVHDRASVGLVRGRRGRDLEHELIASSTVRETGSILNA